MATHQPVEGGSEELQAQADVAGFEAIGGVCEQLRRELGKVIVGQRQTVEMLITALLCEGHTLIVGVPGLAKTMLVRALARALGLQFKRIQFTPDMMPSDIVGTELIQEDPVTGQRGLKFVPGPVFAHLVLADEINRAPPRTQAALLEAMAERQVTVGGRTMGLERPFVVVATQNPIEQEGTYPLPEAQLDRFLLGLWMEYPDREQEIQIVEQAESGQSGAAKEPVVDRATLRRIQGQIRQMPVSRHVVEYAVSLVRATRPRDAEAVELVGKYAAWGAGPRAGQHLTLAACGVAAARGLATPGCEHVREVAMAVLRHRVVVNYAAMGEGVGAGDLVTAVIERVREPRYG